MGTPKFGRAVTVAALGVTLSACAGRPTIPLTDEALAGTRNAEIQVVTYQKNITAAKDPTAGAAVTGAIAAIPGIGVLGAAVAAGTTSAVMGGINQAEIRKNLAVLDAQLAGFDFPAQYQTAVQSALPKFRGLPILSVSSRNSFPGRAERIELMDKSGADVMMLLSTSYAFSSNYRRLHLTTYAQVWKRTSQDEPIYRAVMHAASDAVGTPGATVDDLVAEWAADGASRFHGAMKQNIARMLEMIDAGTRNGLPLDQPLPPDAPQYSFENIYGKKQTIKARLVKDAETHVIVVTQDGNFYDLDKTI